MEYLPLRWAKRLNDSKKSLAIFDEFSLGSDCFAATMQFFAERRIGDIQLHDGVAAVAIMNPVDVSVNGSELPAPMSNRFIHVKWKFDQQEWLDNIVSGFDNVEAPVIEDMMGMVADDKSIMWGRSIVRAFLSKRPGYIRPGAPRDPVNAAKPWPSPRTWTYLSDMLGHIHREDYDAIGLAVRGSVGEGPAREFMSYLKSNNLLDPEAAMDDPKSVDYTSPVDIVVALLAGVEAIGLNDADRWSDAMGVMTACAASQRTDMALPFSRRLLQTIPAGRRSRVHSPRSSRIFSTPPAKSRRRSRLSIRRSRTIFRIQDQHHTPDITLTHPVQITPDAAREAIRAHRDEHGHLHVPSDAWVEVTGCRFPLGYWIHRQRQTRKGRRLLGIIGADVDETDQFFIDGLHHLRHHLRSKYSVPKGYSAPRRPCPTPTPQTGSRWHSGIARSPAGRCP